jgi:hypothetical protein
MRALGRCGAVRSSDRVEPSCIHLSPSEAAWESGKVSAPGASQNPRALRRLQVPSETASTKATTASPLRKPIAGIAVHIGIATKRSSRRGSGGSGGLGLSGDQDPTDQRMRPRTRNGPSGIARFPSTGGHVTGGTPKRPPIRCLQLLGDEDPRAVSGPAQ